MKAFARFLCVLSLTAFFSACGGGGGGGGGAAAGADDPPPPLQATQKAVKLNTQSNLANAFMLPVQVWGNPAVLGPSGSHPWLLGGSEDPWHSVPDFSRVWLYSFNY